MTYDYFVSYFARFHDLLTIDSWTYGWIVVNSSHLMDNENIIKNVSETIKTANKNKFPESCEVIILNFILLKTEGA